MSACSHITRKALVKVQVVFNPPSQGGRHTMPVGSGYAPYLRSGLVQDDLAVRVEGIPLGASFGDNIEILLELCYYPKINYGSLKQGVPVQLIEGIKVVAEGVCTSEIFTA